MFGQHKCFFIGIGEKIEHKGGWVGKGVSVERVILWDVNMMRIPCMKFKTLKELIIHENKNR